MELELPVKPPVFPELDPPEVVEPTEDPPGFEDPPEELAALEEPDGVEEVKFVDGKLEPPPQPATTPKATKKPSANTR